MRLFFVFSLLFPAIVLGKPKPAEFAPVGCKIRMVHVVNGEPLKMNSGLYANANGDSFMVSMYKYYLTDFAFIKADGKATKEKESFHLINESKTASKDFPVNISAGEYTAISFTIGVDSIYNVSGAQGGALDPINAMFWDWNTGYIMAKVEGSSNKAPEGNFAFHIGGFAGKKSVLKRVTLKLPSPVNISNGKMPVIYIKSDVAEWFKTPNTIDFAQMPGVMMEGAEAVSIADNYVDMFSIDRVEQ
jgi:hypothetical protein